MTGAGVVGMGVGGIVGLMAKSKFSTADGETGSKRVSDSDSAVSTGNTASVIVGVGGALAAAGLVVWFVAPSLSGSTKASVGLNGNELVVGGSF
jgi:hypothetical protein